MGFTNKFAESFARSKTMTGPERKANEIMMDSTTDLIEARLYES